MTAAMGVKGLFYVNEMFRLEYFIQEYDDPCLPVRNFGMNYYDSRR